MTRVRGIYSLVALIHGTCSKCIDVFMVIISTLMLYTFVSVALFSKCRATGSSNSVNIPFQRFSYGLSEFSVLLTNDNLIPLMSDNLCDRKHSALLFFSFVFIVQMLLMNMVIMSFWVSTTYQVVISQVA
jgi:hypothetical protein